MIMIPRPAWTTYKDLVLNAKQMITIRITKMEQKGTKS